MYPQQYFIHLWSILPKPSEFILVLLQIDQYKRNGVLYPSIRRNFQAFEVRWHLWRHRWKDSRRCKERGKKLFGNSFNVEKVILCKEENSYYQEKTVVRPSYIYNGNSYTDKVYPSYWNGNWSPNSRNLKTCRNEVTRWIHRYIINGDFDNDENNNNDETNIIMVMSFVVLCFVVVVSQTQNKTKHSPCAYLNESTYKYCRPLLLTVIYISCQTTVNDFELYSYQASSTETDVYLSTLLILRVESPPQKFEAHCL